MVLRVLPAPPRAEGYVNIPIGLMRDRGIDPYAHHLWCLLSYQRFNEACVAVDFAELVVKAGEKGRKTTKKRLERGLRMLVAAGWLIPSVKTADGKPIYRVTGGTPEKEAAALALLEEIWKEQDRPYLVKA